MAGRLVIQLLGEFSIKYNDQPVLSFNSARLQSLLAYLLLHHDVPQPRRYLAYQLWPDSSESGARNNLRQLIYQLRQALPEPDRFLAGDANAIEWQLDGDQAVDIVTIERAIEQAGAAAKQHNADAERYALEQAAHAYQGVLLPVCYDDWIAPEREGIQSTMVAALRKLISLQEQRRDYPAAIGIGQILLRIDPLDENIYILLIRLHRLNDDPAGARRIYQIARDTLERELGIPPGPSLQAAYDQLPLSGSVGVPFAGGSSAPARQALVGRQAEWQQLQTAWQRAVNSSARMVILSGEAGIGKTRLAEEMVHWAAQQGIVTAVARAYGVEGQLTLAPVTEWLRDAAFFAGYRTLEPVWLIEVSRLLPELRVQKPDLPKPEPITEYGRRQRFFEALARSILSPGHPTLLLLDDLQWCDQETIEWLHFLLRYEPQAPLLILGTMRADETYPLLTRLIQQLHTHESVTEIELQALDASETAHLAGQITGQELDLREAMLLYQETEGNPLFVVEMVHAGFRDRLVKKEELGPAEAFHPSALPPRVHALIVQRLAQLSPTARRVAEIGAVYGQPFNLDLLLNASREEEEDLVSALDELWQKRMIREQQPNVFEFTHDKLREVAYTEVSAPQRRLLHRRVAQALEARSTAFLEPVNGQIAVHYDHAGAPDKAIPFYEKAGLTAASVYANDDAIVLLRRGLELILNLRASPGRDAQELALLFAITPCYRILKGWTAPELRQVLSRALVLCDQVGTPAQRAQILYGLQSEYVVEGQLEKVQATYDEMSQLFLQMEGGLPQFAGLMYYGARLHMGDFVEAHNAFGKIIASHNDEQIKNLQASQGVNYLAHGHAWDAHALWFLGYPETAVQCGQDGVRIAREFTQPFNQALTATYLALLQELYGDPLAFRSQAEEALMLAQDSRAPYYQQWAQILVRFADACDRPTTEHLSRLEESIEIFLSTGNRLRLPYYLSLLARAYQKMGDTGKALEVIERAIGEASTNHERCWDAELHRLRGELLLGEGGRVAATAGSPAEAFSEASLSTEVQVLAETEFLYALQVARKQQALAFELRAAVSLARLKIWQKRLPEGRQILQPILERFTEGRGAPDIKLAMSLFSLAE